MYGAQYSEYHSVNQQARVSLFLYFSKLTIVLLFFIIWEELFPNIVLSTLDPAYNLTIQNAAVSTKSLKIIMIFVTIGAPFLITCTVFVFYTFKGKVKLNETGY
ncbi:MAG: cytochrome d ubiquinol oxidase subunit II [Flavobacteriales bacterium AspAUS03]